MIGYQRFLFCITFLVIILADSEIVTLSSFLIPSPNSLDL